LVSDYGTVDYDTTPGFDRATAKYDNGCPKAMKVVNSLKAKLYEHESPTLSRKPARITKHVKAKTKNQSK
jgi:hypothetical protein